MAIIAKTSGGGDFEPLPLGVTQAVCVFVEDIGTHESNFSGQVLQKHQIVICWELAEKMADGRPFMISKFYTLSLHEKATLRKDLENWRGKPFTEAELAGFDVETLRGVNCMLNIVEHKKQDGTLTQKIGSIMPMIKGMAKISPVNTEPPAWIAKRRAESLEAQDGAVIGSAGVDNDGKPLPF
jgi:hypothetical protein